MSVVEEIRSAGWTQGSIVSIESGNQLPLIAGTYLLVTHPCDVVAIDLEKEPAVEFVPGELSAADGNLVWGKNPRRIQFEINGQILHFDLARKTQVPRQTLAGLSPSGALNASDSEVLRTWLASRYARPAFADTFNERTRPAVKDIQKILKSQGHRLSGIYVAVGDEELGPGEDYRLALLATMRDEDFEESDAWVDANEATEALEVLLSGCPGIDVTGALMKSEAEVSLSDLRFYRRWDYSFLSFAAGDSETLPPAT